MHLKGVNSTVKIWAVLDHISAYGSKPGSSLFTDGSHLRVNRGNPQVRAPGHLCRRRQDPRLYSLTEGEFWGCPAQRITAAYSKAGHILLQMPNHDAEQREAGSPHLAVHSSLLRLQVSNIAQQYMLTLR